MLHHEWPNKQLCPRAMPINKIVYCEKKCQKLWLCGDFSGFVANCN